MLVRPLSLVLVAGLLAPEARAQLLELDAVGGSTPGLLHIDTFPGLFPGELVMVIPSTTTGPIPLWIIDPLDVRELSVGIDLLGLAWIGVTGLDGHFRVDLPLPALPALQDAALFYQALTISGTPTFVGRISNPNATRLADAGAFRNRFVQSGTPRVFATAVARPDRSYMLVGGAQGQLLAQVATDTTEIYDVLNDAFVPGPMLTAPRSMHTMTELNDGRWLITGGVNASNDPQPSCEVYDPNLDLFYPVATMNVPRMGHTATLLQNGKVLVTGGLQALTVTPTQLSAIHDATNTAELYDPALDTWTALPNMSTPRAAHMAVLRPDGKVLLAGGISWDSVIIIGWLPAMRSSCELFNPATNTFGSAPAMATPRSLIEPVALGNDRWLFAGGITALTLTNPGTPTANAEIYDAVAGTWTAVNPLAHARGYHKSWPLGGGQFLITGGADGTVLAPNPLSSTEIFSTATNAFTPGPSLTAARAAPAMLRTPQGQVLLGGGSTTGGGVTTSTEWYFF